MGRNLTPKFKLSRREGVDLHPDLDKAGTAKSPLVRKNYAPGMHGPKNVFSKTTNYGRQLREKQKAKRIYGIMERQFSNYFKSAISKKGDTGEVILTMLEHRLDNVIYRLGFAKTRPAARQMVTHGHVLINGKKSTIPSMQVSVGAEITVKEKTTASACFKETAAAIDRSVPSWLTRSAFAGKVVAPADLEEPKRMVDVRQIVEHYSR